jgi:metal-responsive CopG/Arc/MetJ family transcriptional regulator
LDYDVILKSDEMKKDAVNKTQTTIRLPDELLAQLDKRAKYERRNRSNMIAYLLREAMRESGKK